MTMNVTPSLLTLVMRNFGTYMSQVSKSSMHLLRRLEETPPDLRTARQDKPTLLITWWCTVYSITIIAFRVCGRYVRTEKIYKEDTIMIVAIVPLLVRTGLAHVVLKHGTNNVKVFGLTNEDIRSRMIGSRVVLAARIMYAL